MNGARADIWKWLTAFLAGAMLAGAPTFAVLLTRPDQTSNIEHLQAQVGDLQVEQARLTEQVMALSEKIDALAGTRK